jgi:hypothetical protein
MPELSLIDRSFNRDNTGNYLLSLQADQNGLTYSVSEARRKEFVMFRRYRFEHVYMTSDLVRQIISVLDRDDILKLPFHSVRFLGYTQQSTLVPAPAFNPAGLADYLDFNTAGGIDGELFSNLIGPLNAWNVFALPRTLVSLITLHFKKVEFSNQTTPFLWCLSHSGDALFKPMVYMSLNADFFDIAVTGEDKLRLYNTFQYMNETDLLYYVLYVCKQLQLSTLEIPLILSGEMSNRMDYYNTLKQYVPSVRYLSSNDLYPLTPGLQTLVTHKFMNLLYLNNCVLSAENIKAEN